MIIDLSDHILAHKLAESIKRNGGVCSACQVPYRNHDSFALITCVQDTAKAKAATTDRLNDAMSAVYDVLIAKGVGEEEADAMARDITQQLSLLEFL